MPQGRESDPAIERWAGAGHSDDSDPARAGREAVAEAITGEDPRLVLVFAAPRHDFDALAHAAREAAGPAELIGCSGGDGVTAFALGGRGFSAATASAPLNGSGSRAAGESAARCLSDLDGRPPHRTLILLADGLSGDRHDSNTELIAQGVADQHVLIPRAADARDVLPRELEQAGADVQVVPLYETVRERLDEPQLEQLSAADYVTFTS